MSTVRILVGPARTHRGISLCKSRPRLDQKACREHSQNFLGFALEICTLDKGKTRGCRLPTMMRVLTIGLAVLVILSCVTVLITPDLTDDISGILHHHYSVKGHKLLPAPYAQLRPFALAVFYSFKPSIHTLHSSTPRLLALVCVRLC